MGISWRVGGGATYSRILRNGAALIDDAGDSGQQMDCLDEPGTYTYCLEAFNATGESVTQEQVGIVTEAAPQNPLAGTRWLVASMYEPGNIIMVLPGTRLTVAFGACGGMIGSAGCNIYSGSYLVDGTQLTVTAPVATSWICAEPEGIMEQEAAFLSALELADSFVLADTELQIVDAASDPLLELEAQL
jgi:heat shock protein HslJ